MQLAAKLYNGFGKTKAAVVALVLFVYLGLVQYSGGNILHMLWLYIAMALYIALPGVLLARILRVKRVAPGFEGPLALLLGTGFFAALFCLCKRLALVPLLRVLPPAMGLMLLALLVWEARRDAKPLLPTPRVRDVRPHVWMLILLVAFLVFVYAFAGVVKNGRPSAVGDVLLNQDLLWNTGNAESFLLAFPPQDIRFVGVRLHYHYLTELLVGALCQVTGLAAYDLIAFYIQPVVLCAVVYCLYRFGRLCWGGPGHYQAMLFTYSMFLFSCASLWKILPNGMSSFWNSNLTHMLTNINSVATSVVYLCIFAGLFLCAARAKYKVHLVHWALLLAAFFMLSFAKGPVAAIVVIAVGLALLVGLPLKQTGWRGVLLGVLLAGVFLLVYLAMYSSGANDSTKFSWGNTLSKGYFGNILAYFRQMGIASAKPVYVAGHIALYIVQFALMVPAAVLPYARGVGHDLRHFTKISPMRLVANAVALGGMAAFFMFDHPAMSQVYFAFGAMFFVYWLAVDNIGMLYLPHKGAVGIKAVAQKAFVGATIALVAVAVATTAFLYVHQLGSGARQLLRNVGITEKYPYDIVMNADDEAAAEWLREGLSGDEVFATNRIHTGARLEGVSNLYSALSGRQAFMEGFQYAKTNMGVSAEEIARRLEINDALFNDATAPEEVVRLMEENGIGYLLFTEQMSDNFEEYYAMAGGQMAGLDVVFTSGTVTIYALPH